MALLAVLGIAATAACVASAGAGAATRGAPEHRPRVYVANKDCRGHTFRPASITLACGDGNLYVSEVHYFNDRSEGYGSARAGASVTIHENDCKPDCAAGKFIVEKGALTLKRIVRCTDGLLYYSRASYAFPGGENEVDIQPFERCSPVHHAHAAVVRANAPDVPTKPPASPTARALIAARSVQSAFEGGVAAQGDPSPEEGAGRAGQAAGLDQHARRVAGHRRTRQTGGAQLRLGHLCAAQQVFTYVAAHLPARTREVFSTSGDSSFTPPHSHESLPEIEKRESVNFWGEEFGLPRRSCALRLRALGVYIVRRGASAESSSCGSPPRPRGSARVPSYSLLGATVGAVTITVTDRASRKHSHQSGPTLLAARVREWGRSPTGRLARACSEGKRRGSRTFSSRPVPG